MRWSLSICRDPVLKNKFEVRKSADNVLSQIIDRTEYEKEIARINFFAE